MVLREQFRGARRGSRQKHARRRARGVLEPFVRPKDPDERFSLVVVGCHVLIRHGPIETEPISGIGLEVVLAHAQRDAPPMVRAPTEHTRAPPAEVGALGARIRLARHLPSPVDRCVVEAEGFLDSASPPHGGILGQLEHRGLGDRVVVTAGLEHQHLHAGTCEHIRAHAARSSRTHDDGVVFLLPFSPHAPSYPSFRVGIT